MSASARATRKRTRTYSSKVSGPAFAALGSLALGKGFEAFLRAGLLFADREMSVAQSIGINGTTFGSTVWLGGLGVDWTTRPDLPSLPRRHLRATDAAAAAPSPASRSLAHSGREPCLSFSFLSCAARSMSFPSDSAPSASSLPCSV